MIYFDNHPHGHYGTIRQQIWSTLHFPLHLAIVGVVEGSQQIALARYVLKNVSKLEKSLVQYCFKDHLDGAKLTAKIADTVNYFQLDKKLEGLIFLDNIQSEIYLIGNNTGICGPKVTGVDATDLPTDLSHLFANTVSAIYYSLGMKIPLDQEVITVMLESWKIIYMYFWSAMLILLVCFMTAMFLIRRNKADVFDWVSQFSRATAVVLVAAILGLAASKDMMYNILQTPVILPVAVGIIYLLIILDRMSAWIANRRNLKLNRTQGVPLTGQGHSEGHGDDHSGHDDSGHGDAESHKDSTQVAVRPAAPDHRMSYNPLGGGIMPQYHAADSNPSTPAVYSPMAPAQPTYVQPINMNPPTPGFPVNTGYAPGGYMPVNTGQQYGQPTY
jgi:hypothetical protein